MKAKLIESADRAAWNDFAAAAPNSSILQAYEWGEFKACFGWRPLRIALEAEGKIAAGIAILKRPIPFIKHTLYYAPRGPLIDFGNKELLHALLEAVEKEAEHDHAVSLKIDPEISDDSGNLRALGFEKALKQVQPRATFILDLDRDLDEIMKNFEEKTRYNIRLSEKKGVTVKEDDSEAGVRIFCELYHETAKRDNFLVHPDAYYQKLREILFSAGLGSTFIAYYEGKPIAAVIILSFGPKLWYMYGASASEYRNVMPNHLLHWEVIKLAKAKGFKQYDLWGIPAKPDEHHPLFGVYRFKKGFNGRLVKYIGAYDAPYSPLLYLALDRGLVWWQNIRSLITKGKIEDSLSE